MSETTGRALLALGAAATGALALRWLWNASGEKKQFEQPAPAAKVVKLLFYPIRSGKGIELTTAECGVRGLKYDRCWVIVNRDGYVVSQRQLPAMALISPRLETQPCSGCDEEQLILHISAPGMPDIVVNEPPPNAPAMLIGLYRRCSEGVDVGKEVGLWLDEYLGGEGYRMYYMSPHKKAIKVLDDGTLGGEADDTDLTPLLIISEASVEHLNTHIPEKDIPIKRFRPNIIVSGCEPHDEDKWDDLKIGNTVLRTIRPSSRCRMTTVHLEKGVFDGFEPLKTLRKYRMYKDVDRKGIGPGPYFGTYYGILQSGTISVGDTVTLV